jgi:putative membrane protein insertion efficiency factor
LHYSVEPSADQKRNAGCIKRFEVESGLGIANFVVEKYGALDMKRVLLALLRTYKLSISPFLGQNCRFFPSCSDYAREAIAAHGAVKGSALAGRRLCKCHPWHRGGFDPVPPVSQRSRESRPKPSQAHH